jgi:hypothetical protein
MKKLLIGLLLLGSFSVIAGRSEYYKVCHFSVNEIGGNQETIYGVILPKVSGEITYSVYSENYRINLSSHNNDKTKTMKVMYSDVASFDSDEMHVLKVKKSGVDKKVIKDVRGQTVMLRLVCAYE